MPPDPPRPKPTTVVTFPKCKYCDSSDAHKCKVCDDWTCRNCVNYTMRYYGEQECEHGADINPLPHSDWKPIDLKDLDLP